MSDRDNITLPREVVEKAIKAFENGCSPTCENGMIDSGGFHPWGEPMLDSCSACLAFEHLRAALAAPQPEPVAWQERHFSPKVGEWTGWDDCRPRMADSPREQTEQNGVRYQWRPLYADPPAAAPRPEPGLMELARQMKPLDADMAAILHANLDSLYIEDEPAAAPSEDIETLRRENERLQNLLYDQMGKVFASRAAEQMRKQIAELKHAENERLREALKKYGRHLDDCALTLGGYQCTCGFNQQEPPR